VCVCVCGVGGDIFTCLLVTRKHGPSENTRQGSSLGSQFEITPQIELEVYLSGREAVQHTHGLSPQE